MLAFSWWMGMITWWFIGSSTLGETVRFRSGLHPLWRLQTERTAGPALPGKAKLMGDANIGGGMLVRLEGVSKAFGPKDILKNVSMQINDNDRIALVGPNGAGKTTLLKIITGDERVDLGELTIKTNKIVYLAQFPSFDADTTVGETLSAGHRTEAQERMEELESIMTSGVLPRGMDWNEISLGVRPAPGGGGPPRQERCGEGSGTHAGVRHRGQDQGKGGRAQRGRGPSSCWPRSCRKRRRPTC